MPCRFRKQINEGVVAIFFVFHAVVYGRAYSTLAVYKNALSDPLLSLMCISLKVRSIEAFEVFITYVRCPETAICLDGLFQWCWPILEGLLSL